MTDLGIGECEPEDENTKTKKKEKALKRIKKISKDLEVKESDFEITEEQKREIQRLEAKDGKVVVRKTEDEEEDEDEDEKKTKAKELVLEIATGNIKNCLLTKYQEPHAAISVNTRSPRDNPD